MSKVNVNHLKVGSASTVLETEVEYAVKAKTAQHANNADNATISSKTSGAPVSATSVANTTTGDVVTIQCGNASMNGANITNFTLTNSKHSASTAALDSAPVFTSGTQTTVSGIKKTPIEVEAGEKTSEDFYVPYAESAPITATITTTDATNGDTITVASGDNSDSFTLINAKHSANADNASTATKLGTTNLGSTTKPIYLVNGVATEANTYAGGTNITLNTISKASSVATIFAPESSGTTGQVAKATSNGAPSWQSPQDFTFTLNGTAKAYNIWTAQSLSFYAPTVKGAEGYVLVGTNGNSPAWQSFTDFVMIKTTTTTLSNVTEYLLKRCVKATVYRCDSSSYYENRPAFLYAHYVGDTFSCNGFGFSSSGTSLVALTESDSITLYYIVGQAA